VAEFEVYKDKAGKWGWRLRASNGEKIAQSEAYSSKKAAEKGIAAVKRTASKAKVSKP
jgi:uncharacterized protein YegP (UPF0339 family)